MKTTNFFTEIGKFAEHADLKLTITKKGDVMTVSLLPELKSGGDKLMPFMASGTQEELDEGFIPEISKAIDSAGGFKTNTDQFSKAVKENNDEEAATSAKPAKKSSSKKAATKKSPAKKTVKPAAKKPASVKKAAKPKPEKKVKEKKAAPVKEQPVEAEAAAVDAGPVKQQESLF